MMALNHPKTTTGDPAMMTSTTTAKQIRRRRSKGTIAGFASTDESSKDGVVVGGDSGAVSSSGPQHSRKPSDLSYSSAITLPCHSAKLALLTIQNSSRMGARTQLSLCPPGRIRRSLLSASRTTRRKPAVIKNDGYFGLDKMIGKSLQEYDDLEEDFLLQNDTFDVDSDEEEASSGDDDEPFNIHDWMHASDALDDESKYEGLREALFSPSNAMVDQPAGGTPASSPISGKLPFNYRKIKYFDAVSATDRAAARSYLRSQARKCKRRQGMLLSRHLKRVQRRERRRMMLEKQQEKQDVVVNVDSNDEEEEQDLSNDGVDPFPHVMTPAVSAALILESLSLNPVESVEGMAKCYDGIVAAGVALLESQVPTLEEEKRSAPSRSEIMAALAPLLITSLEPASGDVLLALADLRRQCATPRYQRRFVQRVAPALIRPPRGAIWCLRHQGDMEPILAATELILDSAPHVFSKAWHERGRLLLADSKRELTLSAAAEQLKNLSSVMDNKGLGAGHGNNNWRNHHHNKLVTPKTKDSDALAEWEVIAVDRQIRISISNILTKDWTRVVLKKPMDADVARAAARRGASRGNRPATIQTSESSPLQQPPRSPTRSTKAPLSPTKPSGLSSPVPENLESVFGPSFATQPASAVAPTLSPTDMEEPPSLTPVSPPVPRRPAMDATDNELAAAAERPKSPFTTPPHTPKQQRHSPIPPMIADSQTPPRSPIAAKSIAKATTTTSPMRTTKPPMEGAATALSPAAVDRAPLSPSAASMGSPSSEAAVPYRTTAASSNNVSSSAASVGSTTTTMTQTSNYRMLTSTAAERKRTVAACRALRAQISRFEEAFIQLHGRPPKGAAERAPLATTYAQYREWKRAIRADAACRIQAMFRGARTRWILLRSNNPEMARVVLKGAGRSSASKSRGKENVLNELSIPVEIGGDDSSDSNSRLTPMAPPPAAAPPFNDVGVEVYINSAQAAASQPAGLAPHWSSSLPKRRPSSESFPGGPRAGSPPQFPSPSGFSSGSPASSPIVVVSELNNMSLAELQARKRDLKQQLKQYDMIFARKHRRMPVKAEKEPIRHLYEHYNALKTQINSMEQEAQHQPQTPGLASSSPMAATSATQRTPSPPATNVVATITDSDESSSGPSRSSRRKSSGGGKSSSAAAAAAAFDSTPSTPTGAPSQDLAALKAEKTKLHQMLRSYEKDFFKEHKRQVSSFADIKPVASQYRRYKEIKKAIASLQQEK